MGIICFVGACMIEISSLFGCSFQKLYFFYYEKQEQNTSGSNFFSFSIKHENKLEMGLL